MTINEAGLSLIREFEGLRLNAYKCPAGVWTVGYGHTGPDVNETTAVTEETAERLLLQDVARFCREVKRLLRVPVNENQLAALVSFAFNVGTGKLTNSTLLRRVNGGDFARAADEFPKWRFAGGRVLPGLVRRREAERALFLRPVARPA